MTNWGKYLQQILKTDDRKTLKAHRTQKEAGDKKQQQK